MDSCNDIEGQLAQLKINRDDDVFIVLRFLPWPEQPPTIVKTTRLIEETSGFIQMTTRAISCPEVTSFKTINLVIVILQ